VPLSFYIEPDIIPTLQPAFAGPTESLVRKRRKVSFEPKIFLAQVGEGKTITKYQRGQIVFSQGEGCLNGHGLRVATTAAMEECVITRIAKSVTIAAIHGEPDFSELLTSYLLARKGRIEADLIDQLFNSSERRLA
jgi:hypothetical protein